MLKRIGYRLRVAGLRRAVLALFLLAPGVWDGTAALGQQLQTNTHVGAGFVGANTQGPLVRADLLPGADAGAKIAACIVSLPSTGGICDAQGLTGAQTWSSDAIAGTTKPVVLLLGVSTHTVSAGVRLPANVRLIGQGQQFTTLAFSGQGANTDAITWGGSPSVPAGERGLIQGLTLSQSSSGRDLVHLIGGNRMLLRDVDLLTPGRDGFHAEPAGGWYWIEKLLLSNVTVQSAAKDGFNFTLNNSAEYVYINLTTLINCEVRGAGGYPLHLYNVNPYEPGDGTQGMQDFLILGGELDVRTAGSNDAAVEFDRPSGGGVFQTFSFVNTATENTFGAGSSAYAYCAGQSGTVQGFYLVNVSANMPAGLSNVNIPAINLAYDGIVMPIGLGIGFQGTGGNGWSIVNDTARLTFTNNYGMGYGATFASSVAATSESNTPGPQLSLTGSYWTGSASAGDTWSLVPGIGGGPNPTSTLGLAHTGSSGPANVGIGTVSPQVALDINSDRLRLQTPHTPASSSESCYAGSIVWDANYIYVCTAANTWKRATLSSF